MNQEGGKTMGGGYKEKQEIQRECRKKMKKARKRKERGKLETLFST